MILDLRFFFLLFWGGMELGFGLGDGVWGGWGLDFWWICHPHFFRKDLIIWNFVLSLGGGGDGIFDEFVTLISFRKDLMIRIEKKRKKKEKSNQEKAVFRFLLMYLPRSCLLLAMLKDKLVMECFEPSQPLGLTSGLTLNGKFHEKMLSLTVYFII